MRERGTDWDSFLCWETEYSKCGDQLTFYKRRRAAGRQLHLSQGVWEHKRASSWPLNHKTRSVSLLQAFHLAGVFACVFDALVQHREIVCVCVCVLKRSASIAIIKPKEHSHVYVHKCGYLTSIEGSIPVHFTRIFRTLVIFQYYIHEQCSTIRSIGDVVYCYIHTSIPRWRWLFQQVWVPVSLSSHPAGRGRLLSDWSISK